MENEVKEKEQVINTTESVESAKIDAKHTKVALNTGSVINKQKKVDVKIPVDPQNPKDLYVPVIINGYRWEIKRGEKVSLPEAVVKVLEEAKYI